MVFNAFKELYISCNLILEHIHHPPQKEASCAFVFTPNSYPQAQATTDLLYFWTVLYADETGDVLQTVSALHLGWSKTQTSWLFFIVSEK